VRPTDALVDVRRSLHERLIGRVDARQLDAMPRAERRLRVREEALSLLREQGHMLPQSALADVVNAVSDAVVGMGPIEFLLKDPEITEGFPSARTRGTVLERIPDGGHEGPEVDRDAALAQPLEVAGESGPVEGHPERLQGIAIVVALDPERGRTAFTDDLARNALTEMALTIAVSQ